MKSLVGIATVVWFFAFEFVKVSFFYAVPVGALAVIACFFAHKPTAAELARAEYERNLCDQSLKFSTGDAAIRWIQTEAEQLIRCTQNGGEPVMCEESLANTQMARSLRIADKRIKEYCPREEHE